MAPNGVGKQVDMARKTYVSAKDSHVDDDSTGRCTFCGLHESRWPFVLVCAVRKQKEEAIKNAQRFNQPHAR